jgi:hypothetical protein
MYVWVRAVPRAIAAVLSGWRGSDGTQEAQPAPGAIKPDGVRHDHPSAAQRAGDSERGIRARRDRGSGAPTKARRRSRCSSPRRSREDEGGREVRVGLRRRPKSTEQNPTHPIRPGRPRYTATLTVIDQKNNTKATDEIPTSSSKPKGRVTPLRRESHVPTPTKPKVPAAPALPAAAPRSPVPPQRTFRVSALSPRRSLGL